MTSHAVTLDRWIVDHARFFPEKHAIRFNKSDITYADLAKRIGQMVHLLAHQHGIVKGDRIAVFAFNHPDFFTTVFAAARLGAIVVPLNWRLAEPELHYILDNCKPRLLLHDSNLQERAARLCESAGDLPLVHLDHFNDLNTEPNGNIALPYGGGAQGDALFIVYTSGTTGTPKGAVMTQSAIAANARIARHAYDMHSEDHVLNFLPLFHVGGINIQPLPILCAGGTLTLMEKVDPDEAVRHLGGGEVTLVNCVPTILQAIVDAPGWSAADLSAMKTFSIGSTDVPVPLLQRVHDRGVPIIQVYGATETGPVTIYQRFEHAFDTIGSIGKAGIECDIRLLDDDGHDVVEGEIGEICVRAPNMLSHYWNNDVATKASFTDGWFRTGDAARLDADGNYWFADRKKHVVISGGENIYPAELERVLRDMPGVNEVSVVGRPDPKWGAVPVAVIAQDGSLTRDAVLERFQGRLARFKHPRDVVFVDELPRNAMGKVVVGEVAKLV